MSHDDENVLYFDCINVNFLVVIPLLQFCKMLSLGKPSIQDLSVSFLTMNINLKLSQNKMFNKKKILPSYMKRVIRWWLIHQSLKSQKEIDEIYRNFENYCQCTTVSDESTTLGRYFFILKNKILILSSFLLNLGP